MYQKTTLDNGLRVVSETMPYTSSVSIGYFVGTGSRYETEAQAGVSHFIEHVCFKGTKTRPTPAAICTPIEGVGGILNAGTDKELTIYWCKVTRPHFESALDVMTDILLNGTFEPAEIEKERQVIIEEINMSLDSPAQRVSMLTDELLWPGHAMGRDVAGTRESVAAISRRMMLDYIASQYQPGNAVLSMAGAVSHDEVLGQVSHVVADWKQRGRPVAYVPFRAGPGRRVTIEKRHTEQTQLCLALPGLPISNPDRFKIDLINVILGEGMSSRLFTEIRDRLGLAYNIQSYAEHFLDTGAMTIAAGVDSRNLDVAVRAVLEELGRFKTEAVPEEELSKAKELFKGRTVLRMEDSRNVSGWLGGQEILTGQIMTVDDMVAAVEAITVEDLRRVAGEMLLGDGLRLAVVGPVDPAKPLEEILKL